VDVSSGYAGASAKPEDSYFTTVELKVNYLNPAFGEQLVAKAQVVKNGKVLTVVRSDVFSITNKGEETLAATSLVTLMQLSKKAPDKQID
ncbi:PaaI family thioesterase, partial [Zunongwangia profunda]